MCVFLKIKSEIHKFFVFILKMSKNILKIISISFLLNTFILKIIFKNQN